MKPAIPATRDAHTATRRQASAIKIFAVLTAAPRWVTALLWAEGFKLPDAWVAGWTNFVAISALGMALVEGFAFAYIFSIWAGRKSREWPLLAVAVAGALLFVVVLAPSVAASVRGVPLGERLSDIALDVWSVAVAASTIAIVIGVGYALKVETMDGENIASNVMLMQSAAIPTQEPQQPQLEAQPAPALPEPQVVARKSDWLAIRAGLNGDGHDLDAAGVAGLLERAGFALPSPRTLQGWAKETQE